MVMKTAVFWIVAPCSLVEVNVSEVLPDSIIRTMMAIISLKRWQTDTDLHGVTIFVLTAMRTPEPALMVVVSNIISIRKTWCNVQFV
jgi:hypothetical protein